MTLVLRFFFSLAFFVFGTAGVLRAQNTWTGSISTDWNTAGNWTFGVPVATDEVVIPNVANDPVISTATALAFSIQVESGGLLTIAATGSLTINTTATQAIWNQGTLDNNGIITLGNVSGSNTYGINNESVFNNNLAAQINIDNVTDVALYNFSGTFTNTGTITLGANAVAGNYGIQNEADFYNNTGGLINIDSTGIGVSNGSSGMISNTGNITMGANNSPGNAGVDNNGSFINNTGGHISIDRTIGTAIVNSAGDFTNSGTITIGENYECQSGLANLSTFKNEAGGQIAIDRPTGTGLLNFSGTFTNAGNIALGAIANDAYYLLMNASTFENELGGQIDIDRAIGAAFATTAGTINNAGSINIGANFASGDNGIYNLGSFNNKTGGLLNIDRVTNTGIYHNGTDFTNAGTINIGALSAGSGFDLGIDSYAAFNNNTGGQINIDRVNDAITPYDNTFNNSGAITVGALTSVPYLIAPGVSGTFSNNIGGVFKGTGIIVPENYTDAGGILSPGVTIGSMVFDTDKDFTNSNLSIEISGTGTPGTDFDAVQVQGIATISGNLVITTPGFTPSPGQSFVILTANSVTGTFASVTWPAGVTGTVTYGATTVTLNVLTVLPLTLVDFSGNATGNKTALQWKTADEVNTAAFDIERSANGINYTTIGTVKAIGHSANSYNTIDEEPVAGINYYRLKMKDLDGQFKISRVITVKHEAKGGLQLTPVPAIGYVTVQLKDQTLLNQRAQVYNSIGYLVTEVVLTNGARINMTGWPAGMYMLKTSTGSYRFVKQ